MSLIVPPHVPHARLPVFAVGLDVKCDTGNRRLQGSKSALRQHREQVIMYLPIVSSESVVLSCKSIDI
jgi:hypothetical protein